MNIANTFVLVCAKRTVVSIITMGCNQNSSRRDRPTHRYDYRRMFVLNAIKGQLQHVARFNLTNVRILSGWSN